MADNYYNVSGAYFQQTPSGFAAVNDQSLLQGLKSGALPSITATPAIFTQGLSQTVASPTQAPTPTAPPPTQAAPAQAPTPTNPFADFLNKYTGNINLSGVGTTAGSDIFKNPLGNFDIQQLINENNKYRDQIIAAGQPSQQQVQLQTDLAALQKQAADFNLSLQQGQEAQYGLGRPLELSTGRASEMARQAEFKQQNFINQEKNLLTQLGLEKEAQKAGLEALKAGQGILQSNADIAFKAQGLIQDAQTNALNAAFKYADDVRQQAATVLSVFKSAPMDPSQIDPSQLTRVASSIGMDAQTLYGLLDAQWKQQVFENSTKQQQVGISSRNSRTLQELRDLQIQNLTAVTPGQIVNAKTGLPVKLTATDSDFFSQGATLSELASQVQSALKTVPTNALKGWVTEKGYLVPVVQDAYANDPATLDLMNKMYAMNNLFVYFSTGKQLNEVEFERISKQTPSVRGTTQYNQQATKNFADVIKMRMDAKLRVNGWKFAEQETGTLDSGNLFDELFKQYGG